MEIEQLVALHIKHWLPEDVQLHFLPDTFLLSAWNAPQRRIVIGTFGAQEEVLAAAWHELGHVHLHHTTRNELTTPHQKRREEWAAWKWAWDNAPRALRPTIATLLRGKTCVQAYGVQASTVERRLVEWGAKEVMG